MGLVRFPAAEDITGCFIPTGFWSVRDTLTSKMLWDLVVHTSLMSMDWFSWENRNRKPTRFSHEDHGVFRLKLSLKPIHWCKKNGGFARWTAKQPGEKRWVFHGVFSQFVGKLAILQPITTIPRNGLAKDWKVARCSSGRGNQRDR